MCCCYHWVRAFSLLSLSVFPISYDVKYSAERGARFTNFLSQFPPGSDDTVDYYKGVGHSAPEMFYNQPGVYRLFLDNFNGNKSKHADFGTRQVKGDNPHPKNT